MPTNHKGAAKYHPDQLRLLLNELVLNPRLKQVAIKCKLNPATMFNYLSRSQQGHPEFKIEWLGVTRMFHEHVAVARKLSIVALDASARDQALNGWEENLFHDGKPVWRIDPQVQSDAMTMDDDDWELIYGQRKRDDVFARDGGALIQETKSHPPNPQLLVKLLASLAPDIYSDKSELTITHQGHVWVEGDAPKQAQQSVGDTFNEAFALTEKAGEQKRPTNVLAIPAPCKDAAEFDAKFRRKLVREVTLFRDAEGRLQPPLNDDMIVRGSWQDEAFTEAGIVHNTITADELRARGFKNDFLYPDGQPEPEPAQKAPAADSSTVDPLAGAYAALERMPEGREKEEMKLHFDRIKRGENKSRPPTLEDIPKIYGRGNDQPDDTNGRKPFVPAQPGGPPIGVPGSRPIGTNIPAERPGDGEYVGAGAPAPGGGRR